MAKKTTTESRTANYQTIDENASITAKARSLGLELTQAHHCHTKAKSYIINAKIGEPGLLYTNSLKEVEEFLKNYEAKQLASKSTTPRKVPEDTEGSKEEGETVEADDDETEEE